MRSPRRAATSSMAADRAPLLAIGAEGDIAVLMGLRHAVQRPAARGQAARRRDRADRMDAGIAARIEGRADLAVAVAAQAGARARAQRTNVPGALHAG